MAEEFTMMIKEILDKAGLNVSAEQIEAGLDAMEIPDNEPWFDEMLEKMEAESKERGPPPEEGRSWKGRGACLAISGLVELEYSGRARKKYQGGATLLIKPDDSLVVHGMRGVNPVSYIARADDIRCRGRDRKFIITAVAGGDRLVVTFLRMYAFENLFEKAPAEELKPPAAMPASTVDMQSGEERELTDAEKALEARLRKLRIDLAHRDGISFLPIVYNNRTMHLLAREKPKTVDELKRIKGFGAKRIERYAASVLATINENAGNQANA